MPLVEIGLCLNLVATFFLAYSLSLPSRKWKIEGLERRLERLRQERLEKATRVKPQYLGKYLADSDEEKKLKKELRFTTSYQAEREFHAAVTGLVLMLLGFLLQAIGQ